MGTMPSFREILGKLKEEGPDGEGRPAVGWTCTYLPVEILEAGGLHPYRILPGPSSNRADAYLDPNFCPLIRASLGAAIEGEYSFLSGIVMLNTCDGMRRLYDAWRSYYPPPFCLLLDVPRVITPSSVAYFRGRLQELAGHIEGHFEVEISRDRLAMAIEEANSTRSLFKRLLLLQGRGSPPLRYGDIVEIAGEGWRNSRRIFNKALEQFVAQVEAHKSTPLEGLKLVLTGSPLDGSTFIRLIEELGGEVVAADICTGGRFVDEVILSADPLLSLSEAYLGKAPCARMYDTELRISHIKREVSKTGARGVVYFSLKFCDPYLYEAPALQETLRRMGIPVLFIEGEYTGTVSGGSRTRVQAFLEMLESSAA